MSLKQLKQNKMPGCDGLNPGIFIVLWEYVGPILLEAVQYALQIGDLHLSAQRGIICVIPKKGRDPLFLKNSRRITLLNTDYKIVLKLARHMQPYLDKIIHKSQTSFMKGRNISHNIR